MEGIDIKNRLRILLVEDSETDAALLKEHILLTDKDIFLSLADSLEKACQELKGNNTDAVLLDLTLPDSSGLKTVRQMRVKCPDLPIVVLTGVDDEKNGIEAMRSGAQDYLIKGKTEGQTIVRAVKYAIERYNIEQQLRQAKIELETQNEELQISQLALEESRQNYSDLFDFAPLGYFILNENGLIVDVNLTGGEMLGIEKISLLGEPLAVCVCKEYKDTFFSNRKEVFESRACRQCELKLRRADNREFYAEFKIDPVLDSSGTVGECRIAVIDITERKKAEEAVRRAANRFKILSETASELLQSKKPQEIVNKLCTKVMEHLDCQAFFNFLIDEEKKKLHLNACTGISEKIANEIEWLDYGVAVCGCVAKEGKRIIAENIPESKDPRVELIRSFDIKAYCCHPLIIKGNMIGTLSFGTRSRTTFSDDDILMMKTVSDEVATAMERIRTKEKLQKSKEDLNYAQFVSHTGSWRLDIQKNDLRWSGETYRIFGIPKGTLMTYETFLAVIHPDDLNYVDRKWKAALKGDKYDIEHRIIVKEQTKWVREKAELEIDKNGTLLGGFGTVQDITERKLAEEQIKKLADELKKTNLALEDRVKERTSQLEKLIEVLQKEITERIKAEQQLLDNQEKLRSLSSEIMVVEERERRQVATQLHDSIGQLLAFSKKELGALVNVASKEIKPSLQEVWEMIKQAVEQTRTLTFDLSPATLYTLGLDAAIEELGEDFSRKGKFSFKFTSSNQKMPLSEQDKVLLYRSVRELLINITKHSQAKNVAINLKRVNNSIQIVVEDDGIGFNTNELSNGKSGFGLFSIRERFETIGGNLNVQSKKNKGTMIMLTAPLSRQKRNGGKQR